MDIFSFLTSIEWLPAICFLAGFILVITEMFYPGFGIFGISGAIFLLVGIILMAETVPQAFILLFIVMGILGIALAIVVYFASKGIISKNIILADKLNQESGFNSTEDSGKFLGKEGITTSVLRPSGTAEIEGIKIDVVSQGEFIPNGVKIKVMKVEGRRVVVDTIK